MLIMTFVTKSLSFVPAFARNAVTRGIAGIVALPKAIIHRREIMRLSELDERGLKDIGLVRLDVEGALATSWLRDPSAVLAARSSAASDVASARREESGRKAQPAAPVAAVHGRPQASNSEHVVACSA